MPTPLTLVDEAERLRLLADYGVMDTGPDATLDDIVALASAICEAPIALVSLVDDTRQWFAARVGVEAQEAPRDLAFCAHAIVDSSPRLFVVKDARKDPRFEANPLVTNAPNVVFYAGAPLAVEGGLRLGTLCVIDHKPRELTGLQAKALESLSKLVVSHLQSRREVIRDRSRLHALFMQAPMPIAILRGPEHRFEMTNPLYRALVGNREVLGKPMRDALPDEVARPNIERLDRVYATGERYIGRDALASLVHESASGVAPIYLDYVFEPFRESDGSVTGVLIVASDVSEKVEARRVVEKALAASAALATEAERANLAKDEFLATASHELRTPLNAILGWAQLLRTGALDAPTATRGIDAIERNAKAQVRLIDDILDGSRIITGKLRLEIKPLDMTLLVQAALDALRPAADAKSLALAINVDPNAARIIGDPERLQQVVWNLVNNAIKFTPKGGMIAVSLARVGTHIELAVTDNGQGIAPDFLPYVFDRFRQAEGSTTRRHSGLGLGLALVRHLIEAHGGTVSARSPGVGKGATFMAVLPVQAVFEAPVEVRVPTAAEAIIIAAAIPLARLDSVTILVVDDELDGRDLVTTVLRAQGATVLSAANASQALALLASHLPAIMISDIGMPEVDGYELMRRVRASGPARGALMPAVALTAFSREQDRRLALAAGFQHHVTKPVEPAELLRVVRSLLDARSTLATPPQM